VTSGSGLLRRVLRGDDEAVGLEVELLRRVQVLVEDAGGVFGVDQPVEVQFQQPFLTRVLLKASAFLHIE